jgi:hypothetical protein
VLVDRPGHGNALAQRQSAEAGQQHVQLGAGGRVAFHAVVFLLEHDGAAQGQRRQLAEQCRQVTGQYQHALVMDRAGELDLALDVDHALVARKGARRHAHRKSEAGVAQVDLRQGVDLAHPGCLAA